MPSKEKSIASPQRTSSDWNSTSAYRSQYIMGEYMIEPTIIPIAQALMNNEIGLRSPNEDSPRIIQTLRITNNNKPMIIPMINISRAICSFVGVYVPQAHKWKRAHPTILVHHKPENGPSNRKSIA